MFPTLSAEPPRFREVQLEPGEAAEGLPPVRSRLPRFLTLRSSIDPAAVLAGLRVAVVGVGAVGRPAAMHFARLGVGALYLVDKGRYKPESLLTQAIDPDEVGCRKVESVARRARRLSPGTTVYAYDGPFEDLGATALADVDVVVLATDNIRAELVCGQRCLNLGIPLIQASVYGATLTAHTRFYANASADSVCPACALTPEERAALAAEVVYSCEGTVAPTAATPTMSPPHLCALAGDLAVNQVLRHALDLGRSVVDEETEWVGFTLASRTTPLKRNPRCSADHTRWRTRISDRPIADCTLRELAAAAGLRDGGALERATFRVGDAVYVLRAVCPNGHERAVERFVEKGADVGSCAICSEALTPEPFFVHESAPGRRVVTQLDRPLRDLCGVRPQWVLIRESGAAELFRDAPARETRRGRRDHR